MNRGRASIWFADFEKVHSDPGFGSEWSPQFPGYVAGAIEAARMGVQAVVASAAPAASDL